MKAFHLLFVLLFSGSIAAQTILDFDEPTTILDQKIVDSSDIQVTVRTFCRDGMMKVVRKDTTQIIYLYYLIKGQIYSSAKHTYFIGLMNYGDDAGAPFIVLAKNNDIGLLDTMHITRFTEYSDVSIYNDSLLFIANPKERRVYEESNNVLCKMTFDGQVIDKRKTDKNIERIFSVDNQLYGSNIKEIFEIDPEALVIKNNKPILENTIINYLWHNNTLYILSEKHLYQLDKNLNLLKKKEYPELVLIDMALLGESIIVLANSAENRGQFYDLDKDLQLNLKVEESREEIQYQGLVDGSISKVFGAQVTEETGLHHGLTADLNKLKESDGDLKIEIYDMREVTDTIDSGIGPNGQWYRINYRYVFSCKLTNVGDQIVNQTAIYSTPKRAGNCGTIQIQMNLDNLELSPGEYIEILDTSFNAEFPFEKICLSAVSANGKADKNYRDNTSCLQILSTENNIKSRYVSLFPNPTSTSIYLPIKNQASNLTCYDITGKNVTKLTQNYGSELDVSQLKEGTYLIKIQDNQNKIYLGKFVKLNQ